MSTSEPIKSLAIIRFSSLGDIVLVTPVIRHLKNVLPRVRITVITKGPYRELLQYDPAIDKVALLGNNGLWGLVRSLRKEQFDWVVDLHANLRSYLLTLLLRKKRVARYISERALRKRIIKTRDRDLRSCHTVEKYFKALVPLEIEQPVERQPRLYVGENEKQWAGSVLPDDPARDLVGINVGSRWPSKKWPADHFKALIRNLSENHRVVLMGEADDQGFAGQAGIEADGDKLIDLTGQTGLGQLAALISRCRVLVTGDSGPMHMATGLKVPVVALFGPTHPALGFAPVGKANTVITRETECSPCSLHGEKPCYRDKVYCMEGITPGEVEQAVTGILARERQ